MGKFEEDQTLPSSVITNLDQNTNSRHRHRCCCSNFSKFVKLRCIIVLLFSIAVFLSAVFWLPPFSLFRHRSDPDLDSLIRGHDVVASFKLRTPVDLLKANIQQLEFDIFEEIAVGNSMVEIIHLESLAELNTSSVVFAVVPISKSSYISPANLSLLKSTFVTLVLRESSLRLSSPLFEDPFCFEVLKFKGGITVAPWQNVFLLQKHTFFTFILNFSIYQIQENFDELENQLKTGLHLTSHENVYASMTNSDGSTVVPPTTVHATILIAVGLRPPSTRRLKQLAQTITGSHARNLGLNHTVFGKVKQVRLSSVMQHSLDTGAPSPAPLPHPSHHHHHHHHHHRHHSPPHIDLAPSPAPGKSQATAPSSHPEPTIAPVVSPRPAAVPRPPDVRKPPAPAPVPAAFFPASSPSPSIPHIPSVNAPNVSPSHSPLSSSSSASSLPWSFAAVLLLLAIHIL